MIPGVYFVTPDGADAALVLAAMRGGAAMIQLRDKHATDAELTALARRVLPDLRAAGVPLVINDRLEVTLAVGADGLHIGQGDGDAAEALAALAPGQMLGVSVEALAHLPALPPGVDHIGVGPVRATATKPDHAAPIGFAGLAEITRAAPVPVVAIGGLKAADTVPVRMAGCAGIAVVSAISAAADPEAATRALVESWRQR
ncbi:MAG: thiamine phosphate synthase [Rhodobacteraceae bacterium]|nr:thiamine phosphate synthase [Paracoccaceae bacterium]MBR9820073.1 thiamine phosphate synthase [Paracoccaceae bacterium]